MQFCNCEICSHQAGALSSSPPLLTLEGVPSKILEQKLSPGAISEHFCILIGETKVFHDIYAKTGQSRLCFRYLQLNQGDVALIRPVFQEARFGHSLSLNKCQTLIKQ